MSWKWIIGPLLMLHGLLHLVGFLTSWDLIDIAWISRTPTILPDDLPIGVIRDIGVLWLLGLLAFGLAGYGAMTDHRWWKSIAFGSAVVSLVATIFWLHEAWPGLVLNAIIIVLIVRNWYLHSPAREAATRNLA